MKWRQLARRFGVRFVICLVVLGAAYLVLFGLPAKSHNKPSTVSGKIAAIRTLLDETYLLGSTLASFDQDNQVAYSTLGSLQSRLQTDNSALQTALRRAPGELSPELRTQIETVASRQAAASKTMSSRYTVLVKTIEYDPAADLGKLDVSKEAEKLSERARAAQDGLKKTAEDTTPVSTDTSLSVEANAGTPLLVDSTAKKALLAEADCFGKLTDQLAAKQYAEATVTRSDCSTNYPKVRRQVVQNVTQSVTDKAYRNYLKTMVPALLKQLDALLKQRLQR